MYAKTGTLPHTNVNTYIHKQTRKHTLNQIFTRTNATKLIQVNHRNVLDQENAVKYIVQIIVFKKV